MTVNQISVFLENKPGQLAELTNIFSAHGISMRALSMADTRDYGIARIMVDDPFGALLLLKDNGWTSATAFHGYTKTYWNRDIAYPRQGFDNYISGSDYYANPSEIAGMGVSDGEFFVAHEQYASADADNSFFDFSFNKNFFYLVKSNAFSCCAEINNR